MILNLISDFVRGNFSECLEKSVVRHLDINFFCPDIKLRIGFWVLYSRSGDAGLCAQLLHAGSDVACGDGDDEDGG